jgi:hypothetical protein
MAQLVVPDLPFGLWRAWRDRDRPSVELDGVPSDFGCLGLYLLATSEVDDDTAAVQGKRLHPAVVYIGMSTHVDRRLERDHNGVRAYRKEEVGRACQRLRYSAWRSAWTMYAGRGTPASAVEMAALAFYERALLYDFARVHGRLPRLNRA